MVSSTSSSAYRYTPKTEEDARRVRAFHSKVLGGNNIASTTQIKKEDSSDSINRKKTIKISEYSGVPFRGRIPAGKAKDDSNKIVKFPKGASTKGATTTVADSENKTFTTSVASDEEHSRQGGVFHSKTLSRTTSTALNQEERKPKVEELKAKPEKPKKLDAQIEKSKRVDAQTEKQKRADSQIGKQKGTDSQAGKQKMATAQVKKSKAKAQDVTQEIEIADEESADALALAREKKVEEYTELITKSLEKRFREEERQIREEQRKKSQAQKREIKRVKKEQKLYVPHKKRNFISNLANRYKYKIGLYDWVYDLDPNELSDEEYKEYWEDVQKLEDAEHFDDKFEARMAAFKVGLAGVGLVSSMLLLGFTFKTIMPLDKEPEIPTEIVTQVTEDYKLRLEENRAKASTMKFEDQEYLRDRINENYIPENPTDDEMRDLMQEAWENLEPEVQKWIREPNKVYEAEQRKREKEEEQRQFQEEFDRLSSEARERAEGETGEER